MTRSIELLKKAREVGATHVDHYGNNYCFGRDIDGKKETLSGRGWVEIYGGSYEEIFDELMKPIDFTPLDDYYADKALDVMATGVGE